MIDVKNLSKSFGDHLVLNDISQHIHSGEKVVHLLLKNTRATQKFIENEIMHSILSNINFLKKLYIKEEIDESDHML